MKGKVLEEPTMEPESDPLIVQCPITCVSRITGLQVLVSVGASNQGGPSLSNLFNFPPHRIGRVDLSGAGASAWKEQRDSPTEHDLYPSML
ncbi:hypothetical protein NC651_015005 [Populus alba x Populus x berolinensis]|nr:hypothetical protein NC651_015005 [Populus alba x Populus x berolinensis]